MATAEKDRNAFGDFSKGAGSKMTMMSGSDKKHNKHRLTDMQILQQIDSQEDPTGAYAMRKIDFKQ